jgi:hypothetical protein
MLRILLSCFLVFLPVYNAFTQIVITAQEVPHQAGVQYQYFGISADSILVNVGSPGGPQVWDFSQGDTNVVTTDLYLNPHSSPPQYSRANVVVQTDQLNLFGISDPGVLYYWLGQPRYILGAVTTVYQGTPIAINFQPYVTQFPLPLQMGSSWTNNINIDEVYNISGTEYRIELHSVLNSLADAYGTVYVPQGNFETLRIRNLVTYDLTVYIRIFFVWVPIYTGSGSSVNYDWRAENVGSVLTITTPTPEPGYVWTSAMRRLMSVTSTAGQEQLPVLTVRNQPEQGSLKTVYPNPFNAQTTIVYNLPEPAQVDLSIFDMLGRQVAELDQGYRESGRHAVLWSPEALASGVYIAQIRAGGEISRQVVLYLK